VPKIIEDVRERIIEAVRDNVAEEGRDALAIRLVARRAGIAQGTVYNYFASKEEMAFAAIERDWEDFLARAERGLEACEGSGQALASLFASLRGFMANYRKLWDGELVALAAEGRRFHDRGASAVEEAFAALVGRALPEGRVAAGLDRRLVVELVSLAFIRWSREPGFSYEGLAPIVGRLVEADRA
jgi:AcrR family transcriptional regulator